jgi:SAM-dependent methyltransferase
MHPICRSCGETLCHSFADLGATPLANAFLGPEELEAAETFYPLHARVCGACWLVQLPEVASPREIFSDYAYFSSYSASWLAHAERYAELAVGRFALGPGSRVVEVASNDGYLLSAFQRRGIPVLGIEPAANVAAAAEEKGVPTLVRFFGAALAEELAAEGRQADLLVGNNVLAHVPDLGDFVGGLARLLAPGGAITLEFPHLQRLVEENQFDTIYHEHFSYFSLTAARRVFAAHGLEPFDVEELPTHGGSLRVYLRHEGKGEPPSSAVDELLAREEALGYTTFAPYDAFAERVRATKRRLLAFLVEAKERGAAIAGYGAAAKGNTLLNYCGIGTDFLDYVVDKSPHKQGKYLPGTRVPIHPPERVVATRPDFLLVLPWNLEREIVEQMAMVREWGCRFVVPIPEVRVS